MFGAPWGNPSDFLRASGLTVGESPNGITGFRLTPLTPS